MRITHVVLVFFVLIGCDADHIVGSADKNPPLDMPQPLTTCDKKPWSLVVSPEDVLHDQVCIAQEGLFKVVPYKNDVLVEENAWEGVVYKRTESSQCYPILQTWVDYRDKKHDAFICTRELSVLRVTQIDPDHISLAITCFMGATRAYEAVRVDAHR